jgi:hypothetical protein
MPRLTQGSRNIPVPPPAGLCDDPAESRCSTTTPMDATTLRSHAAPRGAAARALSARFTGAV